MSRHLKITLQRVEGTIEMFIAAINGETIIRGDGEEKEWEGEVSIDPVAIKTRVSGMGKAKYQLGIDLEGTSNDQKITLQLEGGYHAAEIII